MIAVNIISIGVTIVSISFGILEFLSKRRRSKSFDEYSNTVNKLVNYLQRCTEKLPTSNQESTSNLIGEVLKLVYHANLFSLKKNIVRASLMWLYEWGTIDDIETVERALDNGYIRDKDNRAFARILIEHLKDKGSSN